MLSEVVENDGNAQWIQAFARAAQRIRLPPGPQEGAEAARLWRV
jgi:hypothetical protein